MTKHPVSGTVSRVLKLNLWTSRELDLRMGPQRWWGPIVLVGKTGSRRSGTGSSPRHVTTTGPLSRNGPRVSGGPVGLDPPPSVWG